MMTLRLPLVLACAALAALAVAAPAGAQAHEGTKIYGGEIDRRTDNFWLGAVLHPRSSERPSFFERQFCAGSLIRSRWLVTAAHCVEDLEDDRLQVLLGLKDLNGRASGRGVEVIDVDRIFMFPGYPETRRGDVALLRLARRSSRTPIKVVAPANESSTVVTGRRTYIAGWGDLRPFDADEPSYPTKLRSAYIPVQANSRCAASYRDRFYPPLMFCAGNQSGKPDTCAGDSGGPVTIRGRLVGVTSFGRCGIRNAYGVYTRLGSQQIADWISRTTG